MRYRNAITVAPDGFLLQWITPRSRARNLSAISRTSGEENFPEIAAEFLLWRACLLGGGSANGTPFLPYPEIICTPVPKKKGRGEYEY